MKNFTQIVDVPKAQEADTNEFFGALFAATIIAAAVMPCLTNGAKNLFSFFDWMKERNKDKKDDKEPKEGPKKDDKEPKEGPKKDDKEPKEGPKKNTSSNSNSGSGEDGSGEDTGMFNKLLMIAKKSNQKEKDENAKKKNDTLLKLLIASSFDKDGNEVPLDKRIENLKGNMTPEQFEAFKKDMTETYEKNKDNQEFKDALKKAHDNIKPEDYDKMMGDMKKEASETLTQLEKEKKEIEDFEKELADLENELKNKQKELKKDEDSGEGDSGEGDSGEGGEKNESKLKAFINKLKDKISNLRANPPQSMVAAVTGVAVGATSGDQGEPQQEPKEEPKEEPKQLTKEEIDAKHKEIEDDYKEKSKNLEKEYDQKEKDLEKEYKDKIDAEKDEDKKKDLEKELKDKKEANEAEWMKKEKALSAAKNKAKDEVDDNDEHDTEKDETKKGKYKVKEEEIEDENGNKIKVKTYTGPRGGKFYYPEGKPKTSENKVYVESLKPRNLMKYLLERLG